MPSFLRIREDVFDTEALKDASLAVPPSARYSTTGYDDRALEVLLRYFADWGPEREEALQSAPEAALDALSTDQKRELYNELTKRLSENLDEQYNRDVDQQRLEGFLYRIADDPLPEHLVTFFLRYLWKTSKRLHEYEQYLTAEGTEDEAGETPEEGQVRGRTFAAAIHRLPSEFLDQKQSQYSGDDKSNHVRFRALETIRSEGSLPVRRYESISGRRFNHGPISYPCPIVDVDSRVSRPTAPVRDDR